ncbi:hypothetical protein L2E82_37534 [Cichorium intybus]|uniref:Uncharacterized protein n=1 Tax=Cichorium intybus TaxID=13427 RepID=A0ACB9AEH8_CICIN|nr:hypothetical protein L2E82_37534 [Cichorium intybus]
MSQEENGGSTDNTIGSQGVAEKGDEDRYHDIQFNRFEDRTNGMPAIGEENRELGDDQNNCWNNLGVEDNGEDLGSHTGPCPIGSLPDPHNTHASDGSPSCKQASESAYNNKIA